MLPNEGDSAFFYRDVDKDQMIQAYVNESYGYTALLGDKVLLIGGVMPLFKGVGEAWLFTSPDISTYFITCFKLVKRYINDAERLFNLYRIEALVMSEFCQGHNFLKHLGFKGEGPVYCLDGQGNDYYRYSRISRWRLENLPQPL